MGDNKIVIKPPQASYDEDTGKFTCNHCGCKFDTEKAVWGHIGRVHRTGNPVDTGIREGEEYLPSVRSRDDILLRAILHYEKAYKILTHVEAGRQLFIQDINREIELARELLWAVGIDLQELKI